MKTEIKLAAMGDLHVKETSRGAYKGLFEEISKDADILVLAGDLCDLGLSAEAEILAEDLKSLTIPVVGVLGNHDYQSDNEQEVKRILVHGGMNVLGTEPAEIHGIGFAGVKGFGGGFDQHTLGSFGEKILKDFVQITLAESLALENQLNQLDTRKKVVVTHYSPIKETLEGESLEVYPFLGSSRLIQPIENGEVSVVFHGHAHHGKHAGATPKGIPVFNVSIPVMQAIHAEKPYLIYKI